VRKLTRHPAFAVVVGVAGALGLGYLLTHKSGSASGSGSTPAAPSVKSADVQQNDTVLADTRALAASGNLGALLPQGVGYAVILITSADKGQLQGSIVGFSYDGSYPGLQLPTPSPTIAVPASAVVSVYRSGAQIA
jgi:hypothetical protein